MNGQIILQMTNNFLCKFVNTELTFQLATYLGLYDSWEIDKILDSCGEGLLLLITQRNV